MQFTIGDEVIGIARVDNMFDNVGKFGVVIDTPESVKARGGRWPATYVVRVKFTGYRDLYCRAGDLKLSKELICSATGEKLSFSNSARLGEQWYSLAYLESLL